MDRINDSRLVQMAALIREAQDLGLDLVRETGYLENLLNDALINIVGHLVAAHVGVRDVADWPVPLP